MHYEMRVFLRKSPPSVPRKTPGSVHSWWWVNWFLALARFPISRLTEEIRKIKGLTAPLPVLQRNLHANDKVGIRAINNKKLSNPFADPYRVAGRRKGAAPFSRDSWNLWTTRGVVTRFRRESWNLATEFSTWKHQRRCPVIGRLAMAKVRTFSRFFILLVFNF